MQALLLSLALSAADPLPPNTSAGQAFAPCPCGKACGCAVCGCNVVAVAPTYYRIGRHVYKDHPTAPGLLVLVSAAPAGPPAAAGGAGGSCANGACGVPQRPGLFFRR